jgi:hypothetical protein
MSSAVLEMKSKVEQLTREERIELLEFIEDIEDNALADSAKSEGGPLMAWDALKQEMAAKFSSGASRITPSSSIHTPGGF